MAFTDCEYAGPCKFDALGVPTKRIHITTTISVEHEGWHYNELTTPFSSADHDQDTDRSRPQSQTKENGSLEDIVHPTTFLNPARNYLTMISHWKGLALALQLCAQETRSPK